jgi:hypothetical protein
VSAHDALQMIDAKVESLREGPDPLLGKQAVIDILMTIRNGLTASSDWSDVTEANLRSRLAAAEAELAAERMAEQFAALLYTSALRHVEGERDRARALAVLLEADLALATVGIQRRVL